MKILVYGAGVLGCNLARNLLRAGKDVTLLARGNWAAEIKQNGLRIKDKFSPRVSISRIPVVTELAPDATYDVIFVVLRYTQLDSVLYTLRANRTKNIVFVGNNVQARALAAALPGKNVLFAFALSAGHRESTAVADIAALATDNKFVMTSKVEQKTIQDNISEETVKTGTGEAQNVFSFDMERVVSQGMVTKGGGLNAETADGRGSVDLDNLTYTAINGAAKTYFFLNHAGDRTITVGDGLYKDFTSAIDDYVDFQNAQDPNGTAKEHLIRLGNLLPEETPTADKLGMYAAKAVAADATEAKKVAGIYFLENSVKKEALTPDNKNFGYYRLPYAKVYTTYTPKEVLHWDQDQKKLISKPGVKGETFYRGEGDGLIYASKDAAKKSQLSPDQKAYTYAKGRCAYRALWNRQTNADGKTIVNANTRRNNTYLLTITAFQGLGMPWDPSDPKDPYLPKPDDKEEPTNPENPDIEKEETYMRVEAKILQWNLVSRDVVLE